MSTDIEKKIKAAKKLGKSTLISKVESSKEIIRLTLGGEDISKELLEEASSGKKSVNEYTKALFSAFDSFSSFFSLLSTMRSSWMPIDDEGNSPFGIKLISDRQGPLESYENTFLRMIGMPSSSDIQACRTCLYSVDSKGNFSLISTNLDEGIPRAAMKNGLAGVLNMRQIAEELRVHEGRMYNFIKEGSAKDMNPVVDDEAMKEINNAIDIIKKATRGEASSIEFVAKTFKTNLPIGATAPQAFLAFKGFLNSQTNGSRSYLRIINALKEDLSRSRKLFLEIYGAGEVDFDNISKIEYKQGFYKHFHLLFPPVQDGEIARCINEPTKIVAEPFLPSSQRVVSGKRIRPTLLEAVIRIRLDSASGTFPRPKMPEAEAGPSASDILESSGPLEAMIIGRLYDSIEALASHTDKKRDEIRRSQKRVGRKPDENKKPTPEGARTDHIKVTDSGPNEEYYRAAKLVEDSMMLFLNKGVDSELINLQENTFRTSSINSAHMMGPVSSIVGAVGAALDSKIKRKDEAEKKVVDTGADKAITQVSSILGSHKGVGIIDAVAFSLALFSIPERALLGLLNDKQYENMKTEFPDGFFESFEGGSGRNNAIDSVNIVTLIVNSVYDIFREHLSADSKAGLFSGGSSKGPEGL